MLPFFLLSCQSSPSSSNEKSSKEETSKPSVFDIEYKRVLKSRSPLGSTMNWEWYTTVEDHPNHDSARYYLAFEKRDNVPQNTAIYQVIYYENGERRTEQSIQFYRKLTHNNELTFQVEDPSNNTIIFAKRESKMVAQRTGVVLEPSSPNNDFPLYRKTTGIYLPGGSFERCSDGKILAFFENEMYQRLKLFMKERVGEKGRSSVILDGLYTIPDFGEPELFLITEIKMTEERSNCNK